MRFAWLQKQSENAVSGEQSTSNRLTYIAYNAVWWIPILLVLIGVIDPAAGFISFTIITVLRLVANLYRNNVMDPEQAVTFPFRA